MAASAATFLRPFSSLANFVTGPLSSGTTTLTILHSANLAGQLKPLGTTEKLYGLGGLENLCKNIRKIKTATPLTMVIHSGNIHSLHTPKKAVSALYKEMATTGYDVVVPDHKNLKSGTACFSEPPENTGLPFMPAASLKMRGSLLPYRVVTKNAIQVALVYVPVFTNPSLCAESLNGTASYLRESKNCHLVICMAPCSESHCVKLATLSAGVDLFISSGPDAFLYNTKIIQNKNCEEALLSMAGGRGTMMSQMDITFNSEGNKIAFFSRPIYIGAENESFANILRRYSPWSARRGDQGIADAAPGTKKNF